MGGRHTNTRRCITTTVITAIVISLQHFKAVAVITIILKYRRRGKGVESSASWEVPLSSFLSLLQHIQGLTSTSLNKALSKRQVLCLLLAPGPDSYSTIKTGEITTLLQRNVAIKNLVANEMDLKFFSGFRRLQCNNTNICSSIQYTFSTQGTLIIGSYCSPIWSSKCIDLFF